MGKSIATGLGAVLVSAVIVGGTLISANESDRTLREIRSQSPVVATYEDKMARIFSLDSNRSLEATAEKTTLIREIADMNEIPEIRNYVGFKDVRYLKGAGGIIFSLLVAGFGIGITSGIKGINPNYDERIHSERRLPPNVGVAGSDIFYRGKGSSV